MIAEGIIHGTARPPSWRDVAEWINHAMAEMMGEERIIKNAWRKTRYKWFLKEGNEIAAAVTTTEDKEEVAALFDEYLEEELPHYIF